MGSKPGPPPPICQVCQVTPTPRSHLSGHAHTWAIVPTTSLPSLLGHAPAPSPVPSPTLASHPSAFTPSKDDVERCKQKDLLEQMMAEMIGEFPDLHRTIVSERDVYLTYMLRQAARRLELPRASEGEAWDATESCPGDPPA